MLKNIIVALSLLALVGCGTLSSKPIATISDQQSLVINSSQFDCGPKVANLPSDEILKTWEASDILGYATEAWLWGQRCDLTNQKNRLYFECFKGNKQSCDDFDKLKIKPKN